MIYDIIIIGGGPGGLTSAIYGVRAGLSVLLFEAAMPGGQASQTHWIDNYPGFPEGIGGMDLGMAMEQQAIRLGAEIKNTAVKSVDLSGEKKIVTTRKETFEAHSVIIATGATPRKLGIDREETLAGSGISYCATCDGRFFKDKKVAVIGGGDTALGDANYLANIAEHVYVIHRRDQWRAAKTVVDGALNHKNVTPIYDSAVEELLGDTKVEGIALKNLKTGEASRLEVDGIFIAVGSVPKTDLFEGQIVLKNNYIETNAHMKTSTEGVYAVGDVRYGVLRQVVTACADGAIAVEAILEYLTQRRIQA